MEKQGSVDFAVSLIAGSLQFRQPWGTALLLHKYFVF